MQNVYKETVRNIINRQTNALCDELNLGPGFNIDNLIRQLGGHVEAVETLEGGSEAQILAINNGQNFTINYIPVTEDNLNDRYTRFAIAHELGHLFLHMIQLNEQGEPVIQGSFCRNANNPSISEWEAEEFAGALLMPERQFRDRVNEVWADETIADKIETLANMFLVPYKNIIVRGKGLGIWHE